MRIVSIKQKNSLMELGLLPTGKVLAIKQRGTGIVENRCHYTSAANSADILFL